MYGSQTTLVVAGRTLAQVSFSYAWVDVPVQIRLVTALTLNLDILAHLTSQIPISPSSPSTANLIRLKVLSCLQALAICTPEFSLAF